MRWSKPLLVSIGRVVAGVVLSTALSVIGIGIAWGMFVFFGAVSQVTLLSLFMTGAGIGAGVGALLAWVRLDFLPSWPVLAGVGVLVALIGTAGAFGGFQFGAMQEVECCTGPAITPIAYTAMGATIAANLAALTLSLLYDVRLRATWARSHPSGGVSAVNGSGGVRHSHG